MTDLKFWILVVILLLQFPVACTLLSQENAIHLTGIEPIVHPLVYLWIMLVANVIGLIYLLTYSSGESND